MAADHVIENDLLNDTTGNRPLALRGHVTNASFKK